MSIWWKKLPEDSAKEQRWYKRMKNNKQKHERMSDQQIMVETVESKKTGIEKRGRSTYYGYDTIVDRYPAWTEDQCLEHWAALVKKSKDKIVTKEGEARTLARAVCVLWFRPGSK